MIQKHSSLLLSIIFKAIVQIFLDLNDGEWVEEAYNAIETIPRSMDHTFDDNNNEDIDQSNDNLVIVNSLIIPNEQITAQVLKRLHQLQQVSFN